tara:strand:- start:351 stop:530 length:180 start_codon:yes stop_codon:yes gene_type:complete
MNEIKILKSMKDGLKIKPTNENIDIKPLSYNPGAAVKNLNSKRWKKNSDGWLEKETSYD